MFFLISTSLFVGQIPLKLSVITVRKRSCRKVMFLHLFVSYSVHSGCVSQHALGQTPPLEQTSPCRHPRLDRHPPRQTPPSGQTSPPGRHLPGQTSPLLSVCWDTTPPGRPLLRTVRILLECILVYCRVPPIFYVAKQNRFAHISMNV